MAQIQINANTLTNAELDGVVGGLNPQPLPPGPPPENFLRFVGSPLLSRFVLAQTHFINFRF